MRSSALATVKPPFRGPAAGPRRPPKGATALEAFVDACLGPALKAKGFSTSAITLNWDEIAGASLARWSEPATLKWPPRPPGAAESEPKRGATLVVRVEGAFALEMQHMAPQLIQRINGFLGWRCVERLQLMQGPVRKETEPPRRAKPVLDVASSRRLDKALDGMEDGPLKVSLARLGVGVLGRKA
ncbi:MAG: DUF721 domain-containing protein [Beijerinckiaceae bacterium]